ncbi:hypothetical protein OJAV_G00042060 [Oryzias javanicus]|uniref:Uncharacterized protein n=1 Tax=Oryzias javanicus TaxID=123683 RepID=A0A437DC31_ORYJA|nr:hypothetical protein OJAV_G00042060 [Oryzias javanicus]
MGQQGPIPGLHPRPSFESQSNIPPSRFSGPPPPFNFTVNRAPPPPFQVLPPVHFENRLPPPNLFPASRGPPPSQYADQQYNKELSNNSFSTNVDPSPNALRSFSDTQGPRYRGPPPNQFEERRGPPLSGDPEGPQLESRGPICPSLLVGQSDTISIGRKMTVDPFVTAHHCCLPQWMALLVLQFAMEPTAQTTTGKTFGLAIPLK